MKKRKNLKEAQIFTPSKVTNQMLDMLDQRVFEEHETFFFEPSCGDGAMLVVILDRIFNVLLIKYGDKSQALADTLFKFYAIELDESLVPKARTKIFNWAKEVMDRELSDLESYLIARSLQQSIENRNFFEVMKDPIVESNGGRALNRKLRIVK
jgi:type I restriction-modification system DNA methylase subunit